MLLFSDFGRPIGATCEDTDGLAETIAGCEADGTCNQRFVDLEFGACEGSPDACTEKHELPGCEDTTCCRAVCGLDAFCCTVAWDAFCAGLARTCRQNPCRASVELCTERHDSPGCANSDCCREICDERPACCEGEWDQECVDLAFSLPCDVVACEDSVDVSPECCRALCEQDSFCCSSPTHAVCAPAMAATVCVPHTCERQPGDARCDDFYRVPGCNEVSCCKRVCELDPFCCRTQWDALCLEGAVLCEGREERANCVLQRLQPDEPTCGGRFGRTVAIDDSTLLLQGAYDSGGGNLSLAAWVFELDGEEWLQQARLTSGGGEAAIHGDIIVVGNSGDNEAGTDAGAAYVYEKLAGGWTDAITPTKLIGSDTGEADRFGSSVAVHGDTIVVGASNSGNTDPDANPGDGAGAAYVFRRDAGSWVEEAKLVGPDPDPLQAFGARVAAGDGVIIVIDPEIGSVFPPHKAYIYRWDGSNWVQEQILQEPQATSFGDSVDIDGDVAVFGGDFGSGRAAAPRRPGSVFVYRYSGGEWIREDVIDGPDSILDDFFGLSLDLEEDRVLIGSPSDNYNRLIRSGSAYLFAFDGMEWRFRQKFAAPDGDEADFFGGSVALGDVAVIGARRRDDVQADDRACDSGAALVFRADGLRCNAPESIAPSDAPVSFTAKGGDGASVEVLDYRCSFTSGSDKEVNKGESCVVTTDGPTITIEDSGGVDTRIQWTIQYAEGCLNVGRRTCEVEVINPIE